MAVKSGFLKNKKTAVIIAIAGAAIILLVFIIVNKPPAPNPKPSGPSVPFELDYQIFKEGYTTPVITVKNLGAVDWKDCEISINKNYKAKIAGIPPASPEKPSQVVRIIEFVKDDGKSYDYRIEKMQSVCISCMKPTYKFYCGRLAY